MLRTLAPLSCALILCALAFGESAETKPAFEAADIHASPATRYPSMRGPVLRDGRYEIRFATMVDLIRTAWSIDAERVLGGPNWLENDTFHVFAKVPAGTTTETAKPMLQALLQDRFKLLVHKDTRSVAVYALRVNKRSQLKPAEGSSDTGCMFTPPPPPTSGPPAPGPPMLSWSCRNMTMAAFAEALHGTIFLAGQYLNQRIVIDETELKGTWDFDLKFTPRAGVATVTLFDAVEKLGLKLDPVEASEPVIVVDSVNQKPTPNLPNVAEALHMPPPPTEFEVAEIKPTNPDFRGTRGQIQPGGRINLSGFTLKLLIQDAWNVQDATLVGVPKWMETDRYDIVAKADIPGPDMDIDDLWPMLQALLKERFHLAVHTEERPVTAYTLMAVKPKMKKADPGERTKYKEGAGADGKDPRDKNPILSRLVTCQNMTMAQFAAKLQDIAPGYIHSPVLDATGLEGGYDFTLSFSAIGLTMTPAGGRGGGQESDAAQPPGTPSASDPTGAVTLFEAIDKQLGLKLEAQKRPVQVLVIDHADPKPTEN
jgi:uncharacterized protein (TIGR03435 family)